MRCLRQRVAICLCVLVAGTALAQEEGRGKLPLWEVGVFALGVSTPAYHGAGQQLGRALVLPYAIYRGDFLRIDRSNIGVRKVIGPHTELDLGFAAAFGASSREIEARSGMPDLGTLVEFGPRIKWRLSEASAARQWRAEVALRGVFDLNAQMQGKGLALEPKLGIEESLGGGWRYGASVGLIFGDRRLTDTLYGVAAPYANAERTAYEATSGLIASRLQLSLSRAVTPKLRISALARLDSLAGSANQASPLVQKNTGTTVGLWLSYTLAQSEKLVPN